MCQVNTYVDNFVMVLPSPCVQSNNVWGGVVSGKNLEELCTFCFLSSFHFLSLHTMALVMNANEATVNPTPGIHFR